MPVLLDRFATPSVSSIRGRTTPRVYTRPLITGPAGPCGCGCALTPDTTHGFAVDKFARTVLRRPLDPWQRWLAIHGLEILPDGRPRFRQVLVIVGRQNGKTELLVILSLFWLFVRQIPMILATSTKVDYARESWLKVARYCEPGVPGAVPELVKLMPRTGGIRRANGEQEIKTLEGARYKIAASNEQGGRSLTVHVLIEDELRQHHDWTAHAAAEDAMQAVAGAQAWAITNQGDDRSVVLNSLRDDGLQFIESGKGDRRLGLFEWSAPDDMDITEPEAWAYSNPSLGIRIDPDAITGKAIRAQKNGGLQEIVFRTEVLCQRVARADAPPITPEEWTACTDENSTVVGDIVLAVDVPPDGRAASIAVAGYRRDGVAHVELVDARSGVDWVPERLAQIKASHSVRRVSLGDTAHDGIVLDPAGPVGGLLQALKAAALDPVTMSTRDMAQACTALQAAVRSRSVRHIGQGQLTSALMGAVPRTIGDGMWAWGRLRSNPSKIDISPLVAVTEALWGLSLDEANTNQPFFAAWR